MHLLPREQDKLILHQAGFLAQKRLARGLRLNTPEATALLASQLQELIRDGKHSVADLMQIGKRILGRRHVLPFVPTLLCDVQVEGTFNDGVFLVTVHNPICTEEGDISLALYGSFFPHPSLDLFPILPPSAYDPILAPGAIICKSGPGSRISLNASPGRTRIKLHVTNLGDRPIQIGSHYHFIETNAALVFDRAAAYGRRLDIPSGTAVRFEPGDSRTIDLVDIAGDRIISGGNVLASGQVDRARLPEIIRGLEEKGFGNLRDDPDVKEVNESVTISREEYVEMFGPTTGDRVRLGDTSLWIEVEKDFADYGDEVKFGGGKTIREGMGQATSVPPSSALDLVITNVLILSPSGIYKADLGIKAGLIVGIGKAGNPATMPSVSPSLIIGATTDVIAGEHLLVTAGAIDAHVHFICPQQITEALAVGTTTMIGGGTGPSTGSKATTCTPGPRDVENMIRATEGFPMNFLFSGKGSDSGKEALEEIVKAGVGALKLHEDWGATPATIRNCLDVADKYDIQVTIHTDTLNESGFVESTIAAFGGRTIHTYHTEGAGGGHAPDIIVVCGQENVLPSSTNPTRPYAVNTLDEHHDMLMVCHHLSPNLALDVAFADSRIRGETVAAEDLLHDLGAISIISSDSQAMGRVGEVVSRTWRTASKMREERGPLKELGDEEQKDNERVKRYLAKYTVNPAIAHGISHIVGSIAVGQLADLVLWKPENFGTKPEMVLKAGMIVWAQMGEANGSIPIVQPAYGRPMFGFYPPASSTLSILFASAHSIESGTIASYNLSPHVKRRIEPVRACRTVTKRDMVCNAYTPVMRVDPETYEVRADEIRCDEVRPAKEVALARGYNFF